jgi:hypothetical protein
MDKEEVDICMDVLIEEDFIRYDKKNFVIMITNCLKFHPINNPNHQKAALKKLEMLPNSYLLYDFLEKAERYCSSFKEFLLKNFDKEDLNAIFAAKKKLGAVDIDDKNNDLMDIKKDYTEQELSEELKQSLEEILEKELESEQKPNKKESTSASPVEENEIKAEIVEKESFSTKLKNKHLNSIIDIPVCNNDMENKNTTDAAAFKQTKAYELTKHLIKLIQKNNNRTRVPDLSTNSVELQNWVKEIERLNRLGPVGSKEAENKAYSWHEIKKIIEFSQESDFWSSNVLSAKSLRKKVIMLENQMKNTGKSKSAKKMDMLEELYLDALEEDENSEKNEVVRMLSYMSYNYLGRFKFPKDNMKDTEMMIEVWYDFLQYYDYDLVIKVLKKLMITSAEWPPTVGELVKEIKVITTPPEDKLNAGEAWALALNAVRRYGYYNSKEAMNFLPEKVRDAVEHFGGFRILCHSDENNGYARSQFIRLYNEITRKDREFSYLPDRLREELREIENRDENRLE